MRSMGKQRDGDVFCGQTERLCVLWANSEMVMCSVGKQRDGDVFCGQTVRW